MIKIENGKDLFDHIREFDVILIGTDIYCNMSQGFQRKIMLNYPYMLDANMSTRYADKDKLGSIIDRSKEGDPTFALLFISEGNHRPDLKKETISYESLEKCMRLANILYIKVSLFSKKI